MARAAAQAWAQEQQGIMHLCKKPLDERWRYRPLHDHAISLGDTDWDLPSL